MPCRSDESVFPTSLHSIFLPTHAYLCMFHNPEQQWIYLKEIEKGQGNAKEITNIIHHVQKMKMSALQISSLRWNDVWLSDPIVWSMWNVST